MNWKEINEKCPKAFLEWVSSKVAYDVTTVKYCEEKEFYQKDDEHCFELSNCDFLWVSNDSAIYFPFYFDQFGIFVEALHFGVWVSTVASKGISLIIINENSSSKHFPDRLSATIAGVTKAFEIREQQLNELNDNPLSLPK